MIYYIIATVWRDGTCDIMRLDLYLTTDAVYSRPVFELKYRPAMNAFVYDILANSPFSAVKDLHDSKQPKLFSFSGLKGKFKSNGDILPTNDKKYMISFSTPNTSLFISFLIGIKPYLIEQKPINLGIAKFYLVNMKTKKIKISKNDSFITDAPICLKDKENRYILCDDKKWMEALIANSHRKLKVAGFNLSEKDLAKIFTNLEIKKLGKYSVPLLINNKKQVFIGNSVSIKVGDLPDSQLPYLEFLFDSGLGSHSSYGFGFIRKVIKC